MNRRDEIAAALAAVKSKIPSEKTLIVVTKTFPLSDIEILYQLGERNFGGNRSEEAAPKSEALPADVTWHFQGQIQSKKISTIVTWADYIHSLDEFHHAEKISQKAEELSKVQRVFLQVNLDDDPSARGGVAPADLLPLAQSVLKLPAISIVGVMGIAPVNGDPARAFEQLQQSSHQLRGISPESTYISAGMSGDFEVALRFEATHIRIGSSILGTRSPQP